VKVVPSLFDVRLQMCHQHVDGTVARKLVRVGPARLVVEVLRLVMRMRRRRWWMGSELFRTQRSYRRMESLMMLNLRVRFAGRLSTISTSGLSPGVAGTPGLSC
jgi:hypothetical protein